MKIYLIAGEPSGDLLGSRLMRAMVAKNPEIEFFGIAIYSHGSKIQKGKMSPSYPASQTHISHLWKQQMLSVPCVSFPSSSKYVYIFSPFLQ